MDPVRSELETPYVCWARTVATITRSVYCAQSLDLGGEEAVGITTKMWNREGSIQARSLWRLKEEPGSLPGSHFFYFTLGLKAGKSGRGGEGAGSSLAPDPSGLGIPELYPQSPEDTVIGIPTFPAHSHKSRAPSREREPPASA